MNGETAFTALTEDELLARFVLFTKWIRSNGRVAQDAFIPDRSRELSVIRHLGLTEDELWSCGQEIADSRPATLYGRADIQVAEVTKQSLRCVADPPPRNHVNIVGWPEEKSAQKILAMELATKARYVVTPTA